MLIKLSHLRITQKNTINVYQHHRLVSNRHLSRPPSPSVRVLPFPAYRYSRPFLRRSFPQYKRPPAKPGQKSPAPALCQMVCQRKPRPPPPGHYPQPPPGDFLLSEIVYRELPFRRKATHDVPLSLGAAGHGNAVNDRGTPRRAALLVVGKTLCVATCATSLPAFSCSRFA